MEYLPTAPEALCGAADNYLSILWISSQNSTAASLVRIIRIAVSSPARLPTKSSISMPSMAAPAALARPGMVLSTTIFWATSKEVMLSLKMVRSRPARLSDAFRSETA